MGARRRRWLYQSTHSRVAYSTASKEARSYLQHPVLGPRLLACTAAANKVTGRTANQVFGSPDDVKFRSTMTLFGRVDPTEPAFREALARYFDGQKDPRTLEKLGF
jgi:uncharacterized protein (DUF1810 family)